MDRTLTQLGILFTENMETIREAIAAVQLHQKGSTAEA